MAPLQIHCKPSAPPKSSGTKYIRNYSRKDYDNHAQNWSIIQDKRGIIYVGNHGGLMEFDGISWREIAVTNKTVRSLAVDRKGIIYVGGTNELGYLAADPKGTLKYESLTDQLDKKYRNFSGVWRTHATQEGIYFCTSKFLFLWNFKKMTCKAEANSFFAAPFLCRGKLYVRQDGVGLLEMKKDSLELLPGGDAFSSRGIAVLLEYEPGKLLIGTDSGGLYLYDDDDKEKVTSFEPFETDAFNYIKKNPPSYGLRLSSGDFALATNTGGVVVIDREGNVKDVFNKKSGLQDDDVKYIYEDFQGNLWLCLDNGTAKIEYASPFSFYDDRYDLPGHVLSVARHRGDLYAGTTGGLYLLGAPHLSPFPGKFRPVPGITGCCMSLLSTADSLLVAADKGVFQIKNNGTKNIAYYQSFTLYRSRKDSNRTWVGTNRGLASLYFNRENNRWAEEYQFENIKQEIRTIVEDNKGNLWLGTRIKGTLRVEFSPGGTTAHPDVTNYHTSHGLPAGEVHVFMAAGHVMFATGKGIFRFDENKKVFLPDNTFGDELAGGENGRGVFRIAEDKKKNTWIHSMCRNIQAILQPGGTYILNKKPFLRIPIAQVNTIYPDPDGETAWFASVDGLVHYNTNFKKNYDLPFPALIRKVWVNEEVVFDGYRGESSLPIIDYKDRNLGFDFAAPFFEAESKTEFSCFLEGYDDDWAGWTSNSHTDYTNLDSGFYTFRVRARNVYENLSKEAVFQFKVLPPWYKTWWAFSLYALAAFFMVFLIVKWRSSKLEKEKSYLEQVVEERTKEINEKKLQLEEQSEKLKEMDKVKSRFFANISHEFRTPLTLIMGPLEQVLSEYRDEKLQGNISLALDNSQRLLSLINQLLDLSKLDGGKMRLRAVRQNIIPFLKGTLFSFDSLAIQRKLELKFYSWEEDITLYYDPEKMERVVCNLLANAVKFTPTHGKITLSVKRHLQGTAPATIENFPGGFVEISVHDTGIGIPEDQLEHIFDRFYRVEDSSGKDYKGTGIGLALVEELVALHHGEIEARSSEGKGSEFIIRLPLGEAHLKPEDILGETEPEVLTGQKKSREVPAHYIEREGPEAHGPAEGKDKDVILVVEDNPGVRNYIRGPLEPLYTVIEAKDGKEGIEKAKETIPDLIISDVMMPEVDGYELCKVLKNDKKTSHIPVVMLTAKASEESVIQGLETGADDYITKPFNTRILLTRIKNLIDLRRQLQEKIQREMVLQPTEIEISSVDREFMKELQEAIEKNLSDEEFGIDELANTLYMSRATLNRKIRALTGESSNHFIQSYRLKRAAQLLKANFGNVTEVAYEVGFSSSAYFTKCFKEKFHQLPHHYQASGGQGGSF